jgi:DNA primase
MTVCPFKSHKGGREQTPSFKYYAHSNSFNCFGCKIGGGGCQLVMNLENCSKIQAAEKIMARWGEDCTNDGDVFNAYSYQNQEERFKLLLKFSQIMRDFYSVYQTPCALAHMEQACQKFDSLFFKRNLSDEAITRIIEQMQIHLSYFKP